jgi:siroheme synthase
VAGRGKVYLVGAGVCGKEMLTLRAAELIAEADVVIYDRLVHESVLGLCNDAAEKVYMGKVPKEDPEKQQKIIEMMISEARRGKEWSG